MNVDRLRVEAIEGATLSLLEAYTAQFPTAEKLPVPVDDIMECHLNLDFGLTDLIGSLGVPDVLGALWIEESKVRIDQSLDPSEYPQTEGRYRYTVAHECGHWILHRRYFLERAAQRSLFDIELEPSIVCRSSEKEVPIEWQADTFASYLLMPRDLVLQVWESKFGSLKPYLAANEIAELTDRWGTKNGSVPTVQIAREMAGVFKVSGQAMQIRLAKLGLVEQDSRPRLFTPIA